MNATFSRTLVTATLVLAASPALAECPTGDDLKDGITLAQNTPFFMRSDFKRTEEGFVEERVVESGGQAQKSMALYRHGLVMVGEHSPSGHVEITYVDALSPLETLPEKGTVSISGVAKGPLGESFVELEVSFVEPGSVDVAECRFETWVIRSTLKDRDGAGASFRMDYAPELGLVLAASVLGADGQETPAYAYQWAGRTADLKR